MVRVVGLVLCLLSMCWPSSFADDFDSVVFNPSSTVDGIQVAAASSSPKEQKKPGRRYFIYDVYIGEGFNLRRDVYMRAAQLVKELVKADQRWIMVLPPWRHLYHWQSGFEQQRVPWRKFFDLDSLREYIPVMEFEDYLKERGDNSIDQVFHLQGYAGGWKNGEWEEKIDQAKCLDESESSHKSFQKDKQGRWHSPYFGYYEEIYAKKFACVSVQGTALILKDYLLKTKDQSILVDRFEKVLHPVFGEREYWLARKSMGYAKHLKNEAEEFMAKNLPSRSLDAKIKGHPYLAVHLRRGDFLRAYWGSKGVPKTLESAAKQIKQAMKKQKLKAVYIATDSSAEEVDKLKKHLPTMVRYEPSEAKLHQFGDGGVSIIDQWICANAQYFIGTDPSTFTFRINEDRELMNFPSETTFNGLCLEGYKDRHDEDKCSHPTKWKAKLD